jgi:regulator of protease activity HflC (stomatin/prohibitin superfamily)
MIKFLIFLLIVVGTILSRCIRLLYEYERGVKFSWGRYSKLCGPGIQIVLPLIHKLQRIDTRRVTMDVPAQDVITHDNISVKVNAVIQFMVVDPAKAVLEIEDYFFATSQLAQTTLRSVCGEVELDDLLAHRDKVNEKVQKILDQQTDAWGVKVTLVEVKHIDLPHEMQRAMAKQAEAERERRAKIIQSEGEFQAAEKLRAAADIMSENSTTLQLRYLETLRVISAENSSTVVFPIPMEMLKAFEALSKKS